MTRYGTDPEITRLVDTKTIYARPMNNPDGSSLYHLTAQTLRSTVRPNDTDGDGLLDEDAGEDLDGDGFIRQMRRFVGKGKGNTIKDPKDPKGRAMRRVRDNEGDFELHSEGVDSDGDGRYNEDGIGGLDLHRNYPENWRPMREETGRGQTQAGAGEYPLSEPETRAVFLFLMSHPNLQESETTEKMMEAATNGRPQGLSDHTARSPARPVEERVKDWDEVYVPGALLPIITEQADRCMDCGIPFCHDGCPLGNLIPEWNDLVSRERLAGGERAAARDEQLPRVHRAAVPGALRGGVCAGDQPARGDHQERRGRHRRPGLGERLRDPAGRRSGCPGRTVAVIGSGPAGLAAAQQLTRAGHTVAVYERDDRIGGLLRYGIPAFKMEKRHLDRRHRADAGGGHQVPYRRGASARDIDAAELRARYDAVVIAVGATDQRELSVPGPGAGRHPPGDGVPAAGQPGPGGRLRPRPRSPPRASTWSSSAAGTPARTVWARRCGRAPPP